jgi:general stress protein CsbA
MEGRRVSRSRGGTLNRLDAAFVAVIFVHLAVVLVHTVAHLELQIVPGPLDLAFVLGVILIGPVAALPILRFNRPLASGLLAVLMAAAFAYGFQSHFLIVGPDDVSVVATNVWTLVFVVTAMGIGVLELVAVGVAAILFVSAVRNPSEHLGPRT